MSVYAGPEIVNSGLVFYIDFANPKSISGNTVTDLCARKIPVTLENASNNTLTITNGYAEFSPASESTQSTYYSISNTYFNEIKNEITVECVMWANSVPTGGNRIISPRITESGSPLGFGLSNTNISVEVYSGDAWKTSVISKVSNRGTNTWTHVTQTTSNTANVFITYVNGANVGAIAIPGTLANGGGFLVGRGYYGGTKYAAGRVSYLKIYDRALSESEIKQNFNALRGRFGI